MTFRDLYPDLGLDAWTPGRRSLAVPDAPTFLEVGRGSKGAPVYNVHSYHTKVPPEAIEPFIAHYTQPGAVVLDPFAGSGMTGVAARRLGRNAILNDLSPAAAHIGWNVTHGCDPVALTVASERVLDHVRSLLRELYSAACGECGQKASIAYTIWSDRLECPKCGEVVSVWEACADRVTGAVSASVKCSSCRVVSSRRACARRDRVPVWVATDCPKCGRSERAFSADDSSIEAFWRSAPIPDWYPTTPIGADREMYIRSALGLQGVAQVSDFYTARNLRALAAMWAVINRETDVRLRQALAAAFTNTAWHGTIMRRFNARGGQRPLTGTLYVPHLSSEVNVANVFAHKIRQLGAFYRSEWNGPASGDSVRVNIGSATQLPLPDSSVDYVFTDPPFGSSIFYSDVNLIWESWLGELTDVADEAVVNRSLRPENGGKTVAQYRSLMTASFAEMRRVLRRNASMTVVFHSTDGGIWEAIEEAAGDAALCIVGATYLDKGQLSHKGYKGRDGSEDVASYDVVLEMKPRRSKQARTVTAARRAQAADILAKHLATLPSVGSDPRVDYQRTLPYLHSLLVQHHFNGDIGLSVGDYDTVRAVCAAQFKQDVRGHWFNRAQGASEAEREGAPDGKEAEACCGG